MKTIAIYFLVDTNQVNQVQRKNQVNQVQRKKKAKFFCLVFDFVFTKVIGEKLTADFLWEKLVTMGTWPNSKTAQLFLKTQFEKTLMEFSKKDSDTDA